MSAWDRKRERRARGIPELRFRDYLARGWSPLMAQYGAYIFAYGRRGCWKSARKIAGDKKRPKQYPGELPPGRRGQHHPNSLPRVRRDPRWKEEFSSERIPPHHRTPSGIETSHGAVHIVNRMLHAAWLREQRKQRRKTEKPPGLVEHEERRSRSYQHVGSLEEAVVALGFAGRPPPA